MANRTCRRCGARVPEATASAAPRTEHTEPVMRRWPHPVAPALDAKLFPLCTFFYLYFGTRPCIMTKYYVNQSGAPRKKEVTAWKRDAKDAGADGPARSF